MSPRRPPSATMRSSSASGVAPTRMRAPSYVRTSSDSTLSSVFPAMIECTPQELLPIMPPSVQQPCVAGSGPNVRPWPSAAARSASRTTPGSTRAVRASGSISTMRARYFEQSSTTATLQHWPARLVPPPRGRIGASCARQTSTAATTSSTSRGTTTPMGTWR